MVKRASSSRVQMGYTVMLVSLNDLGFHLSHIFPNPTLQKFGSDHSSLALFPNSIMQARR